MMSTALSSPDAPFTVRIDPSTGLTQGLTFSGQDGLVERQVRLSVSAIVGGKERRGWTGGVRYEESESLANLIVDSTTVSRTHRGTCDEFTMLGQLGELTVKVIHRLYPTAPYAELVAEFSADKEVLIRNVTVLIDVIGDPADQELNVPGNAIHRGLRVQELGKEPFGISPIGGLRGSSGLIAVTVENATLTVWPNQQAEIPDIALTRESDGLRIAVQTNFAAAVGPDSAAELVLATFDLQPGGIDMLRAQWPDWAARYALTTPPIKPAWVASASLYEAQIGTSHFWGGNSYTRYSEISELTADLDRIRSLRFSVIQLMPRQPYPSYNVHDYADISTSYGDEAQLRELVSAAHAVGMRIILDVLLHGVLDNESVDLALSGIHEGPLASRLDEETGDSFGTDLSDSTNYHIAWSRHILDFAPYWKAGAPVRTELEELHPEWFMRDSAGAVTGVYTKAFDARNRSWQLYFRHAMMHLVHTLDIDGFRFDAPTYNAFPSWSDWAKARASMSSLGCVPLFVDLRRDIKTAKPDALMYTEPSGHLLRRSMDLNYNYDEQWLVTSLANNAESDPRGVTTAREFMIWLQDRDAFLPVGGQTAHHIDSHDTFWWPQWGKKWRREQFGIEKVRALTAAFISLDGPYMMFTGGEEGIEEELRALNGLRRNSPALWDARAEFDTDSDSTGDLFIIRRTSPTEKLTVVVNLTGDGPRDIPAGILGKDKIVHSASVDGRSLGRNGYVVLLRSL